MPKFEVITGFVLQSSSACHCHNLFVLAVYSHWACKTNVIRVDQRPHRPVCGRSLHLRMFIFSWLIRHVHPSMYVRACVCVCKWASRARSKRESCYNVSYRADLLAFTLSMTWQIWTQLLENNLFAQHSLNVHDVGVLWLFAVLNSVIRLCSSLYPAYYNFFIIALHYSWSTIVAYFDSKIPDCFWSLLFVPLISLKAEVWCRVCFILRTTDVCTDSYEHFRYNN